MNAPFVPNVKGFKKHRRRLPRGVGTKCYNVVNKYGIQVITPARIFSNHVETTRRTITNFFKRSTKVYIRIFPNRSYTAKPPEVRRGKGKGSVEGWYYYARPNTILMEFDAATLQAAKEITRIVNSKLPCKIKLCTISKSEFMAKKFSKATPKKVALTNDQKAQTDNNE